MALPQLLYLSPSQIITDLVAIWEVGLGKTILPQQPEYQAILATANREMLIRAAGDYARSQSFVDTAVAPNLDYLAANRGVTRLEASPAVATLRFTLVPGHTGVTFPNTMRVSTVDEKVMFKIDTTTVAATGTTTIDLEATATTDGDIGNNYSVGSINKIIDAVAFVSGVTNINSSAGGSSPESDEQLRERIKIANSQFSTAGPVNAYKYFARQANPSIIDVAVVSPEPGRVSLYPLIKGGIATPQAILDAVFATVNADDVRPITDTVEVLSPTRITYVIPVTMVLRYGAVQAETVGKVTAALALIAAAKATKLGEDVTETQLKAAAWNDDVIKLDFLGFDDLIVGPTSFAACTSISIGVVTYENPDAE